MLRNVLGTRTLGDILSDRVQIAQVMYDLLAVGTLPWVLSVERVEVKDVKVPEQLMRAMAAEAEAAREARAKVRLNFRIPFAYTTTKTKTSLKIEK